MPPRGLFITGTDTGVGKTFVVAEIVRACRQAGYRVGVYKPAASGCDPTLPETHDAWQLWDAAGRPLDLNAVCPQSFRAPLAPHLAARAEGRSVDPELLVAGIHVWRDMDLIIVEGAGGLMCPLTDDLYVADLAAEFQWPLVVVAANRLGVINHTLQTLIVAETFRDGLAVAGTVLNDVASPQTSAPNDEGRLAEVAACDPSCDHNLAELQARCVPPVLTHVPWNDPRPLATVDWWSLARESCFAW